MTYEKDLENEITNLKKGTGLKDDEAFVLWFLKAEIIEQQYVDSADQYLVGGKGDKTMDAIYVDDKNDTVHVLQGKFHRNFGKTTENSEPVMEFADIAEYLRNDYDSTDFESDLNDEVRPDFQNAKKAIEKKNYQLILYFITTYKCSDGLKKDAKNKVKASNPDASIYIYDFENIKIKYEDYIYGVAPGVPEIKLKISAESKVSSQGVLCREDDDRDIKSMIFSVNTKDIGKLYKEHGVKLFARNIRGYLGPGKESSVNNSIRKTIDNCPENFWYYNNGITVICSDYEEEKICTNYDIKKNNSIIIKKPQIINGQQTTITLSYHNDSNACVLVKLIKIPYGLTEKYKLINEIVKATNWQNYIKPADLVSNEPKQIQLERLLAQKQYAYLRKKRPASVIKQLFGTSKIKIRKEDLAKAIAVCMFGPESVKKMDDLFENKYERIFRSEDPIFYLNRYWLMTKVRESKITTESTRANWQVLHFAWNRLKKNIENDRENKFEKMCRERDEKNLKKLKNGLGKIFQAAMNFYKINKGKGSEEKDIRSFFNEEGQYQKFEIFWRSQKNATARKSAEKYFKQFEKALLR